ncbi:MAG TPA: HAD hydrolase family protein [Candidatus Paceibacterota bacterium]
MTSQELIQKAKKVKIILFDVDGILTSGLVNIMPDGSDLYTFNVYDGYGIKLWQRAGFKTGFITGRGALPVKHRADKLGVHYLYQNSGDKLFICEEIAKKEEVSLDEIAFMGDDLQDLSALRNVGFAATVPNGRKEVIESAHYVTEQKGGDGAARELVEFLLQSKGLWEEIIAQERILS